MSFIVRPVSSLFSPSVVLSVADSKMFRNTAENDFLYQTIGNSTYSVDTFFFVRYRHVISVNRSFSLKAVRVEKREETTVDRPRINP